jgi:1,4-alpha-glucan branching enzyme
MPGDQWSRFANLRLFYTFFYASPGKKLMFMGNEFAQEREWNADISLDWHLADAGPHAGVKLLVRDLNHLYRTTPALYDGDCDPSGFAWIDYSDADQGVVAFLRRTRDGTGIAVVVCHFTPVIRRAYRIGVPVAGRYVERLNSDAERYGGGNQGNAGGVESEPVASHGHPHSICLTLPPFGALILEAEPAGQVMSS